MYYFPPFQHTTWVHLHKIVVCSAVFPFPFVWHSGKDIPWTLLCLGAMDKVWGPPWWHLLSVEKGVHSPALIPWFWLIVLVQWFQCSCSAVEGFYPSWVTKEPVMPQKQTVGSTRVNEAITAVIKVFSYVFPSVPATTCLQKLLFVFCGSHRLLLEHSACLCSWGMGICWYLLFSFIFHEMALWVWKSSFNIPT